MGKKAIRRFAAASATIGLIAVIALAGCDSNSTPESVASTPIAVDFTLLQPAAPIEFEIVNSGRFFVTINWDAGDKPTTNAPTADAYEIRWRNVNEPLGHVRSAIAYEKSATLNSLVPGSVYEIDVRALSESGIPSVWTQKRLAATSINRPPAFGSRSNIFTVPEGSTGLIGLIKASDPDGDEITFQLDSGELPFEINSESGALRVTGHSRLDFDRSESYRISVNVIDEFGASTRIPVTVFVKDLPPPPPMEELEVQGIDFRAAKVNWQQLAAYDLGQGAIYELRFRLRGGSNWHYKVFNPNWRSTTLIGLQPAADYDAQIRAASFGGEGQWSPPTTFTTGPNQLPVFRASNPTLYVAEDVIKIHDPILGADDPDGDRLDFDLVSNSAVFKVDRSSGQIELKPGNRLDFEQANWYQLEIRATDEYGAEALQLATILVTDKRPPLPPTDVDATSKSRFQITINWLHSVAEGRVRPSGFEYTISRSGQYLWSDAMEASGSQRTIIRGLKPGTSYDILVRANSEEGPSDWSLLKSFATEVNLPPRFDSETFEVLVQPNGTIYGAGIVHAEDPEGDSITYSLLNEREEFFVDEYTGRIILTADTYYRPPRGSSVGSVAVATDEYGAASQIDLTVTFAVEPIRESARGSSSKVSSGESFHDVECAEGDRGRADARRQVREFRASSGLESGETEEEARYWDALIAACEALAASERTEGARIRQEALREAGEYNPNAARAKNAEAGSDEEFLTARKRWTDIAQAADQADPIRYVVRQARALRAYGDEIEAAVAVVSYGVFTACATEMTAETSLRLQRDCFDWGKSAFETWDFIDPIGQEVVVIGSLMLYFDWWGEGGPEFQAIAA